MKKRNKEAKDLNDVGLKEVDSTVLSLKPKGLRRLFATRKALVITITTVLVAMVSVISGSIAMVNYRNTPVYQGMEVSSEDAQLSGGYRALLMSDTNNDFIDEIESSIGVEIMEGISYYAEKDETIVITVQIDNPQSFEILSFTLNGKLYQTFEFIFGSNSNQIMVYFTVQDTSGIQELTIDAIKYVDGSQIKNARFGADKTVKVGVLYENIPTVTNVNELVQATTFGVSFVVSDAEILLNLDGGLTMYLFDGETIIHRNQLVLGTNVMPYSNLRMGQTYAYAVVGVFDSMDGLGKRAYILHQNEFTTKEGFEIESILTTYEAITVTINKLEFDNAVINKAELYLDDVLVQTLETPEETFVFNKLLSNADYDIQVHYSYQITEESEVVTVNQMLLGEALTLERPLPEITLALVEASFNTLEFAFTVIDTYEGEVTKVEVFLDDQSVYIASSLETLITNLLSDTNYKIVVTYAFDLVDGNGIQTMTKDIDLKTLTKIVPVVSLTDLGSTQTSLSFDVTATDTDGVGSITSIELYQADVLIDTLVDLNVRMFTDLLSNNAYKIKVTYTYNLGDGAGDLLLITETTLSTLAKLNPVMTFDSAIVFLGTLFASFRIEDYDDVGTLIRFDLYIDGVYEASVSEGYIINSNPSNPGVKTGDLEFTVSGSGTYTIYIIYEYDLSDGNGIIEVGKDTIGADNKISYIVS